MNKLVFQGRDIQRVTVALTDTDKQESRQEKLRRRQEDDGLRQLNIVTSADEKVREAVKVVAELLRDNPGLATDLLTTLRADQARPAEQVPDALKTVADRLADHETRSDEEEVQELASTLRERPDLRGRLKAIADCVIQKDETTGCLDERLVGMEHRIGDLASLVTSLVTDLRRSPKAIADGAVQEDRKAGGLDERLVGIEHRIGDLASLVASLAAEPRGGLKAIADGAVQQVEKTSDLDDRLGGMERRISDLASLVTNLEVARQQVRSEPIVESKSDTSAADAVQALAELAGGAQIDTERVRRALAVFPHELQPWLTLWVQGRELSSAIVELARNRLSRRVLRHLHASPEVSEMVSYLSEAIREMPQDKVRLLCRAIHVLSDRPTLAHFTLASSRCDTTNEAIRIAMKDPAAAFAGNRLHRLGAVRLGVIKTVAPEVFKATSPRMPEHLANDDTGLGPRQLG